MPWDPATPKWPAYYIAGALERHCGEVRYLSQGASVGELWTKVRNRLSRALTGNVRPNLHDVAWAQDQAKTLRRRLTADIDLIFAHLSSGHIAFLDTDIPVIYSTDATFELVNNYYPDFTGLDEGYVAEANQLEMMATQKASALLYPSQWAADSAMRTYGAPPERVHVIPYGANLLSVPDPATLAPAKPADRCNLAFLGTDWERKAGPLVYQTVLELRRRGLETVLTVCGANPGGSYDSRFLRVIPRVDKSRAADSAALASMLLSSNFLLQPARQELFGIAYCEASAHGTPSIAADTGGVSAAVVNGENGFLLPPDSGPEAYANLIWEIFQDRPRYLALVASSRKAFDTRLNWDAWGAKVGQALGRMGGR
jgi:glycosyltransferase involved in cell wall biosynthesis